MIRYNLKCDNDHIFESWFQSGETFDKLNRAGMVACDTCGSPKVSKSVMAPSIAKNATPPAKASTPESALAELKAKVESTSVYVGTNFAREARDMHDGLAPERAIYGEANLKDAKALIDDGIPVMPLPFIPSKKTN